jgi:hypothetical protein
MPRRRNGALARTPPESSTKGANVAIDPTTDIDDLDPDDEDLGDDDTPVPPPDDEAVAPSDR